MDHRRSLGSGSPTSPLSRAGSNTFRSPLSQIKAQAAAHHLPSDKPLPLTPFELRTPYRNRSARASVIQVRTGSPITSHAASFESDSEEIGERYDTAPLSRVWSTPEIEGPAVEEGSSTPSPQAATPALAEARPRPLSITAPLVAPVANIVAPTPISPSPNLANIVSSTPSSSSPNPKPRPASLSLIGLELTEEEPVNPRSEPSPLRRAHAISRRPSPTQLAARAASQAHSVAHSAPEAYDHSAPLSALHIPASVLHTHSQSYPIPSLPRPTVSSAPRSGSRQSLPPPPPRPSHSTRRHSDTTLGRSALQTHQNARPASSPLSERSHALPAPVAWAASEAATYTHVLLRASAFAQHLADRRIKCETASAMLAFLHAEPDDPAQLSALLSQLGDALIEDHIADGGGSLLDRLLSHLSTHRGFDALFTTNFHVRRTCTSCGADAHSTASSWAAPHSGASVAGVRRTTAACAACGTTEHSERWAPVAHGSLLLIEPEEPYVCEKMVDRAAGVEWSLVGAAVPLETGMGFIAMEDEWTLFKGGERVPVDLSQPLPTVFVLYERV